MRLWRRKRDSPPRSPGDERQVWTRRPGPLDAVYGPTPESTPLNFEPKPDPSRDKVYDDEVDPAWRDPDTAE